MLLCNDKQQMIADSSPDLCKYGILGCALEGLDVQMLQILIVLFTDTISLNGLFARPNYNIDNELDATTGLA